LTADNGKRARERNGAWRFSPPALCVSSDAVATSRRSDLPARVAVGWAAALAVGDSVMSAAPAAAWSWPGLGL